MLSVISRMKGHILHSLLKSNYYVEWARHPRGQKIRRVEAMHSPWCCRKEGLILCALVIFPVLPSLQIRQVGLLHRTWPPIGLGICMLRAYILPLCPPRKTKQEENVYASKCLWKYFAIFIDFYKKKSSYALSVCSSLLSHFSIKIQSLGKASRISK